MSINNNSNFYQDKVNQLLAKVAKTEPTVELELYWQKRYQEIVDNLSFNLSEHTVDMVFETIVTRPSTPSGLINIEQILDDKNQVKESSLQNIVETSVRLLDAILDIINFDESARQTVKEFRKIAIGIENLESYLTIPEMFIDQVDYLGEIISNSVYRSSESLAEEKGACQRWEDIKNEINPKSFEYWFNPDSGEIRTSLEIQEYVTNSPESYSKIVNEFEIVARRGSHLLLYPDKPEWSKWSDRKSLQPKTKVDTALEKVEKVEKEIEEIIEELDEEPIVRPIEDLPEFLKPSIEKANEKGNPKPLKETSKNFAFPEMVSMEDILPGLIGETKSWTEGEDDFSSIFGLGKFTNKSNRVNNAKPQIQSQIQPQDQPQAQKIEEEKILPIKVEITDEIESPQSVVEIEEEFPVSTVEAESDQVIFTNLEEDHQEVIDPQEIILPFSIGELVKVPSESKESDFYQIVDIRMAEDQAFYHLTDRDDAQIVKICVEKDLQPALLEELILSANVGSRVKSDMQVSLLDPVSPEPVVTPLEYLAQVIVFNQNGQVLLASNKLPEVRVPQGAINIDCLINHLDTDHNIFIKDIEEIGTFAADGSVQTIFLGQLDDELNQIKIKELMVFDIDKALTILPNLEKYLSTASEKEMQAKKRYSSLNNLYKASLEENQNLKQKIRLLGLDLQVLADENPGTKKTNNIQKAINTRGEYNYIHITEHSKFSKFFPTLEQVVTDDEIGKLTLKIQYDTFGAKKASIDIESDKLRDKDYTLITSYLNLVNTSLASGASLADVSFILEHQGKGKLDFGNNLINKILLILSLCFLSLPASIEQVNSSDIIIVTLAKVLESISQNKSLLELVLESKSSNDTVNNIEDTIETEITEKPTIKNTRLVKKSKV